ncbi:MAG TPA: DUF4112 domain-containing protein [Longimicrobium sp.]|nr:DUF4112 domain-containing protein [Longimicrobium sp.]
MERRGAEMASAGEPRSGSLRRLDGLAYLLDNSIPIPGTGRRVGLDAVIGLVPGVGDAAGSLLSAYIVVEAARAGTPFPVLARMVMNVAIEGIVGAVPFLGDLFDAAWKANDRNVRLLRAAMASPDATRRSSKGVVLGVILLLLLVLGGVGVLSFLALRALVQAL